MEKGSYQSILGACMKDGGRPNNRRELFFHPIPTFTAEHPQGKGIPNGHQIGPKWATHEATEAPTIEARLDQFVTARTAVAIFLLASLQSDLCRGLSSAQIQG